MPLDDLRRHRARRMAASMESTSASPGDLANWQAGARLAIQGLRDEYVSLGLDDDAMAWIAFGTAHLYATLSALRVSDISEMIDHSMTVYALAAGALAGVYAIPPGPEAGSADGAVAPSASQPPPAAELPTGQYL